MRNRSKKTRRSLSPATPSNGKQSTTIVSTHSTHTHELPRHSHTRSSLFPFFRTIPRCSRLPLHPPPLSTQAFHLPRRLLEPAGPAVAENHRLRWKRTIPRPQQGKLDVFIGEGEWKQQTHHRRRKDPNKQTPHAQKNTQNQPHRSPALPFPRASCVTLMCDVSVHCGTQSTPRRTHSLAPSDALPSCPSSDRSCRRQCVLHSPHMYAMGLQSTQPCRMSQVMRVEKKGRKKKHRARTSHLLDTRASDHVSSLGGLGATQFGCQSLGGRFSSLRPSGASPDAIEECMCCSQPLHTRHTQSSLEKRPQCVRKRSPLSRSFLPRPAGCCCVVPFKQHYYPPRVSLWSVKRLTWFC